MSARSTTVKFNNTTSETLTLTDANLSHGVWSRNLYPPKTIAPKSSATWMSESDGFMTGTEGTVTYLSSKGNVTIHWDNPYVGSNSYSDSAPSGFVMSRTGGDGDNATVSFTFESSKNLKTTSFAASEANAVH